MLNHSFKPTLLRSQGTAMNADLNDGWSYWLVIGEQIEKLQRRYNIFPAEAVKLADQPRIECVA